MPPCNRARGEVVCTLAGEPRRLCLTLGALAELETAFAVDGWEALSERLRRLSARDLGMVLGALLRGGGEGDVDLNAVDFREAAEAVAAAFTAAGG
ncbi:MAG TPA: GTA-gp10 family protein [Caulobacteraceae bacterium]|nr:GTA-gp10 family protein [Caulobacteraceae bacterium]